VKQLNHSEYKAAKAENETMAGVIPDVIRNMLRDVHCMLPAKIEKYDKVTRRAEVTPTSKYLTSKGIEVELQKITDVPVCFVGGSAFNIDIEYQAGDIVMLGYTDYGIGAWKSSDGQSAQLPDDLSAHQLTNAIVLCGVKTADNDLSGAPKISADKDGNIIIKNSKSTITMDKEGNVLIDAESISFNGDDKPLVTHLELDTALQTMLGLINAHIHITTATVGATAVPGIIAPTAPPITLDISSSATTTVKTGG
jgi:hypothetical protein